MPTESVNRPAISDETQVAPCTPLVMWPTGVSDSGTPGHRSWNIARLTSPCSADTPLRRSARRMPITAMLKRSDGSAPGRWPSDISSSRPIPHSEAQRPKYFSISSRGNWSMPAGTGVWVVNTAPERTASNASAKDSPSRCISIRMRSRPRKPAWPSLVWKT